MIEQMDSPQLRSVDLVDGEKVLWSGKPVVAMVAGQSQGYTKLYGLFFVGFAVFWMLMASGMVNGNTKPTPAPLSFFPLFGLPFLGVGLYIAFGPNYVASQRLKNTFYVLTNRRAVVVTEGSVRTVKAYDLSSMTGVEKQTRPDGCGAIVFQLKDGAAVIPAYAYRNSNQMMMMNVTPPGFYGINDVDSVYRLFESTRTGSS